MLLGTGYDNMLLLILIHLKYAKNTWLYSHFGPIRGGIAFAGRVEGINPASLFGGLMVERSEVKSGLSKKACLELIIFPGKRPLK